MTKPTTKKTEGEIYWDGYSRGVNDARKLAKKLVYCNVPMLKGDEKRSMKLIRERIEIELNKLCL